MTETVIARTPVLPGFTTAAAVPQWQPADYRTAIHETAAAAYNQIRFIGLSRDPETKTLVRDALRTALDLDAKGVPAGPVARLDAYAPATPAATREFFVTFFQTYSAPQLNQLAAATSVFTQAQPAETDQLIETGWLKATQTDPEAEAAFAKNSMRGMITIAVSDQLQYLFSQHDKFTTAMKNSRTQHVAPGA